MVHASLTKSISIFAFILSLSSCNKGFTLRIGDQDIYAFGSQEDCNFVQNSQGVRVSWKSSTPIHFVISASVPPEYDSAIIQAAATWNARKPMNLIQVHRDNLVSDNGGSDGINAIYWINDWTSDQMEQGRTSIKWDISKIQEADIKVNAKDFKYFKTGDTITAGRVNLESLMLHEFGHAMGLKHLTASTSAMQPYLASGINRNNPGDVDISSLSCEY